MVAADQGNEYLGNYEGIKWMTIKTIDKHC